MTRWLATSKEELILALLLEHGDLYGLELVERAGGELKRGTVYVTLSRMQDKGLVEARPAPEGERTPGLPRPRYRITASGRAVLEARALLVRRGLAGAAS